jgi:hypothetical protein
MAAALEISLPAKTCRGVKSRLNAAVFLPGSVQWRLSTTECKRALDPTPRTCGRCGGRGGGGRQQHSLVLAVARHGLAPCLPTMTNLRLGIDAAI